MLLGHICRLSQGRELYLYLFHTHIHHVSIQDRQLLHFKKSFSQTREKYSLMETGFRIFTSVVLRPNSKQTAYEQTLRARERCVRIKSKHYQENNRFTLILMFRQSDLNSSCMMFCLLTWILAVALTGRKHNKVNSHNLPFPNTLLRCGTKLLMLT